LMWSGAALATDENLEVQSTNLTLDFQGRAVLYTIQGASTITVAQYVTSVPQDIGDSGGGSHLYDTVVTFADGAKAGWRGCTGTGMCVDSASAGSAGSSAALMGTYTDKVRVGPGNWHTEGVVSDQAQKLRGWVEECESGFTSACAALSTGSRLIWVHKAITGESSPSFSGTTHSFDHDGDGGDGTGGTTANLLSYSVTFNSAAGTGTSAPAEGTAASGNTASGTEQLTLYDFAYSGEFRATYDLVVELSVQHQENGEDNFFRFYQVIWGEDNDGAAGTGATASSNTATGLNVAATN